MWELLVFAHIVALVVCNVVDKPEDDSTKFGKYFWAIQLLAGLVTSKVKK
ncbi:hypothetical protein [Hyphomicrobium sp. ghe19]|nr:hypothetical protein HYPP_02482 [Hyphomicrobium sp. ghe19]